MNNTVTDAYGIDAVIKKVQEPLYSSVIERWSLTGGKSLSINGYGRVYRNMSSSGKKPEAYLGNGEYADVFYDDNADANFFFLVSDRASTDDEVVFSTDVKVVFCMNLEKCLLGEDRMDGLAHRDAMDFLRNNPYSGKFVITGYETGLENIFSGYSISGIEKDNLQPYHCFAVLIDLNYSLTDKCT